MSNNPLFSLNASFMTTLACFGSLTTIVCCYLLAVSQGNVPIWLPMISDCALFPPESYLFRLGLISSSVLLNMNAFFMLCYKSVTLNNTDLDYSTFDKVAYAISTIASTGLAVVGAVNEREDSSLHGTAAVIFFSCYLIYMAMVVFRLYQNSNHSALSLQIKIACTLMGAACLIAFAFMSSNWGKYHTYIAVVEWTGTFCIILGLYSFVMEYGTTLKIAVLLESAYSGKELPSFEKQSKESLCSI